MVITISTINIGTPPLQNYPRILINPFHSGYRLTATLANSGDSDEMPHNAIFHWGLHCLQI